MRPQPTLLAMPFMPIGKTLLGQFILTTHLLHRKNTIFLARS
ncbi:MAG: hypothetical protein AAF388_11830 [Bacteroidota bacterium]